MSKKDDTIRVSSESKLQLPLANLIGIILLLVEQYSAMQTLQVGLEH